MEKLGFTADTLPILWVALITWGGVLAYLFRLDRLTGQVRDEVRAYEEENESPALSDSQA